MVERDRPQMTIRRMRITCWITKAMNTLRICSIYCFSLQQCLHERASMLRYTYSDCLVCYYNEKPLYVHNKHGIWEGEKYDFRCPPLCRWNLLSSGMLRNVNWYLCRRIWRTYFSNFQEHCLTLEEGTDSLYRNVAR